MHELKNCPYLTMVLKLLRLAARKILLQQAVFNGVSDLVCKYHKCTLSLTENR